MDLVSNKLKEKTSRIYGFEFLLIIAFVIPCMGSCTIISTKIDNPIKYEDQSLQTDITHYSNVLNLLGPPSKISKYNKGLVFLYETIDIKERQLGFGFKEIFKWFKFSFARGNADRQVLVLIFNEKGYLTEKQFDQFDEKIGSGQGISIIVSIQSLVDTSNLEENPDTLVWGKSLLNPMPEVLNIPNNLKSGETGVEQLGSPTSVGQHTLEMQD